MAGLALCAMAGWGASQPASADELRSISSNAVNFCQAFTPGPTNTIRNRVIGLENIGPPLAVACNFHQVRDGSSTGDTKMRVLNLTFVNNAAATQTVTCTMLIADTDLSYAANRSVTVAAGATTMMMFPPSANPTPGANDFGSDYVGVNCVMPTGMMMTKVYYNWFTDS